jgi:type IV secretory pathway VirB2 component (pilin)
VKLLRKGKAAVMGALAVAILTVAALANTTPTNDVSGVMESSFQNVVGDILGMLATILPIALGVFGATIAITFGIRWFRRLIGK